MAPPATAARRLARRAAPSVVQDFPQDRPETEDLALRSIQAQEALAAAIGRGAAALERCATVAEPAAEAIASLSDAQKRFCNFIVAHRLKLTASIPVVLVAIGAISPNAARVIGELLRAYGL